MYIDANDVKLYMDLKIHQQIADFINKSVAESQKMYLEDLEGRLQGLLVQEVTEDTVSDVGVGIELALKEVKELLEQFEEELETLQIKGRQTMKAKDKEYWGLINEIVELKNEIADEEKEILNCTDEEERAALEEYMKAGSGLVEDRFLQLIDMGYKREEIEMDIAYS